MKLILALGTGVGAALAMSGCGLILDQHPDDTGVSIDAGEFDARDAPLDVGNRDTNESLDAASLDAVSLDAVSTDAAHHDGGIDAGSEMPTDDAGRDAGSDAGRDAGSDAGRDAFASSDAGRDAFAPGDAGPPSTRMITVTGADVDVTAGGNSVIVAAASGVSYFRWDPRTGWPAPAPRESSTVAAIRDDDETAAYVPAPFQLRLWGPSGFTTQSFSTTPTLLSATHGVMVASTASDPIYLATWAPAAVMTPGIPGPCTPWSVGPATVLSIAVAPSQATYACGPRVAAGVELAGIRSIAFSTGRLAQASAFSQGPRCHTSMYDWSPGASDFGNDIALLQQTVGLVVATTTGIGPVVLADGYFIAPRSARASSVALGVADTDVLIAWTEGGAAYMQSLPQLHMPAAGSTCSVGAMSPTRIGTLDDATKVRISDCNSGVVTAVVRGATQVEIVRMPCPRAPLVTIVLP